MSGTPSRPSADAIYQGAMWSTSVVLREPNAVVIELPSLAPIRRTLETSIDGVQHDFMSIWSVVGDSSARYLLLRVVFREPNEQLALLFDPSVDREALTELGEGPMAAIAPAPDADFSDLMHDSGFLGVQLHLDPGLLAYVYGGARWHTQRDWLGWTTSVIYLDGPTIALRFEARAYPTEQAAEAASAAASQAVPPPAVALANGPVVVAKARTDQIKGLWEGTATTAGVPIDLPFDVIETNIEHDLSRLSHNLNIRHAPALISETRPAK